MITAKKIAYGVDNKSISSDSEKDSMCWQYGTGRAKMNILEAQGLVEKFTKDKNIDSPVEVRIIDLASESGELSKEVLKGTNYGSKAFEKTEEWDSEIGDVLFSLICIANQTKTSLEDCLKQVLDKYEKRFADKGDLGSGR